MDAGIETMDRAVGDFAAGPKGGGTWLFCFAGHGVAIEGISWLIPVSPCIDDAASVKPKAVAVDAVVGKMDPTEVRAVLGFLDSRRDNCLDISWSVLSPFMASMARTLVVNIFNGRTRSQSLRNLQAYRTAVAARSFSNSFPILMMSNIERRAGGRQTFVPALLLLSHCFKCSRNRK